ncbi:MAG: YceK/YidQ family lipoprotein [Pontiellaceae bacterium]|nr:YceK/YidQ family lipoprotein [Pontiellaceae bacterium]
MKKIAGIFLLITLNGCGTLFTRGGADIAESGCYCATRLDAFIIGEELKCGLEWGILPWTVDLAPSILIDTLLLPIDLLCMDTTPDDNEARPQAPTNEPLINGMINALKDHPGENYDFSDQEYPPPLNSP